MGHIWDVRPLGHWDLAENGCLRMSIGKCLALNSHDVHRALPFFGICLRIMVSRDEFGLLTCHHLLPAH